MKAGRLRAARPDDLDALVRLEHACFEPYRRASRASLERSLRRSASAQGKAPKSAKQHAARAVRQSVWVVPAAQGTELAALLVLWHHAKTLRIYDIATHPDARGQGLGGRLMRHAQALARRDGARTVSLEAEELDPRLVAWYEGQGFAVTERLADYYHAGCSALRMAKRLE